MCLFTTKDPSTRFAFQCLSYNNCAFWTVTDVPSVYQMHECSPAPLGLQGVNILSLLGQLADLNIALALSSVKSLDLLVNCEKIFFTLS